MGLLHPMGLRHTLAHFPLPRTAHKNDVLSKKSKKTPLCVKRDLYMWKKKTSLCFKRDLCGIQAHGSVYTRVHQVQGGKDP